MCVLFIYFNIIIFGFYFDVELPDAKLHSLLLDHKEIKLTWVVDWYKREILFNVDEAFTVDSKWFSFGFSKRGSLAGSDICFFIREPNGDSLFQSAVVSRIIYNNNIIYFENMLINKQLK